MRRNLSAVHVLVVEHVSYCAGGGSTRWGVTYSVNDILLGCATVAHSSRGVDGSENDTPAQVVDRFVELITTGKLKLA